MITQHDETRLWTTAYATPMMDDAYQWVTDVVVGGHTGGVLYGPPRRGKSMTVWYLATTLRKIAGPRGDILCETLSVITPTRKASSEGGFWDWLAASFGHPETGKGSQSAKRQRVYKFMWSVAQRSPSGKVLFFIDEAQKLDLEELGWVADLFNELNSRVGFEFIVFLVGPYQLEKWKHALVNTDHASVKERFFLNEHELRGLSSVTDFGTCLGQYDEMRVSTEGPTMTAHFLPDWFASGGRMKDHADAFREAFLSFPRTGAFVVPMAYFVRSVRTVFENTVTDFQPGILRQIVESTKYPLVSLKEGKGDDT